MSVLIASLCAPSVAVAQNNRILVRAGVEAHGDGCPDFLTDGIKHGDIHTSIVGDFVSHINEDPNPDDPTVFGTIDCMGEFDNSTKTFTLTVLDGSEAGLPSTGGCVQAGADLRESFLFQVPQDTKPKLSIGIEGSFTTSSVNNEVKIEVWAEPKQVPNLVLEDETYQSTQHIDVSATSAGPVYSYVVTNTTGTIVLDENELITLSSCLEANTNSRLGLRLDIILTPQKSGSSGGHITVVEPIILTVSLSGTNGCN